MTPTAHLPASLQEHPFAVVHLDADWNHLRVAMATELGRLRDRFPDVHFADIDIDVDTALARQLGVLNVPTVLYLAGGRIEAMCIGLSQPLAENLERLLRGEPIAP